MQQTQTQIKVVWEPIPGTSQELALDARAGHTLYCGTRGPGKTDTQLMRFRSRVGIGYGRFWRGVIFDREYKNLEDLIVKSERWFNEFNDGAKFLRGANQLKWVWPTGEELLFRVAAKESDYWKYHGHEYPFIGWNELTKYPNSELYDMMCSTNRSSFRPEDYPLTIDGDEYNRTGHIVFVEANNRSATEYLLPPIPLEVFSTTNPYGVGHGWVKRKFIDVAPYGVVHKSVVSVVNPKTKRRENVEVRQVAIFGSYLENIYLDSAYIATLFKEKDKNRRKAWLTGDWNIVAGGAFDDLWNKLVHVKPRFVVPKGWYVNRTYDDGSSHPFSVGWWAEANGEDALIVYPDGAVEVFCPQPGSLIQIYEWYGTEELGTNKGIKASSYTIAEGIVEIEAALLKSGWIQKPVSPGPADNRIRNVIDSALDTAEKMMQDKGVHWMPSDKSPGSRFVGLQLFRTRLECSTKGEGPGIYFMDCCKASVTLIPNLPRDPKKLDDVNTEAEDHTYDMTRYRILQGNNRYIGEFEHNLNG